MEDYKRKYSEVSERLMERNRQYQKLQGLYDSLRLRNMVVGMGERDAVSQPAHLEFNGRKSRFFFLSQIDGCFCCLGVFNTGLYFTVAGMDENIGMNPEYFHLVLFCVCKLHLLFRR